MLPQPTCLIYVLKGQKAVGVPRENLKSLCYIFAERYTEQPPECCATFATFPISIKTVDATFDSFLLACLCPLSCAISTTESETFSAVCETVGWSARRRVARLVFSRTNMTNLDFF